MLGLRRFALFALLLLPLALAGCGHGDLSPHSPGIERILLEGRQAVGRWVVRGRAEGEVPTDVAIPLGYLERLRLGLGSPFRLIDYALADPRLDDSVRVETAHALLARTLDGQAYQVEPAVLDLVGLAGSEWVPGVGAHHLKLIEGAIAEAPDPRGGELAVRLAYALAAAEGSVDREAPALVAQAAALIRDRELARADALRLIRAAEAEGVDPVQLVAAWRAERRFAVEAPLLTPIAPEPERESIEMAPRLAQAVQALGPRLTGGRRAAPAPPPALVSLLGARAARVLDSAAVALGAPPTTPVAIAVEAQRPELRNSALTPEERDAWRHFLDSARGEERLAAGYATLLAHVRDAATPAGEAVLTAAVGLKTYAQERVWYPAFGGPAARELEDRFGLAHVRFDDDVPAAWRPYYRRMLADALGELLRVLPSLDLSGLGIWFGAQRGGATTLALHDPGKRTIFLTPETGVGTLAHEIAHDLDWQTALRRYRVRGDYATDRATRQGDRLAAPIRRLTSATLRPPIPGDPSPVVHALRPAEVFARSVDWFVMVSLAREGRMNGYLSSAQDAVLTGYGSVRPPELNGDAGQALMSILDEMAPVYPATREWFLRSYGPGKALTPTELVRSVVEVEAPRSFAPLLLETAGEIADDSTTAPELRIAGMLVERFDALRWAREGALTAIDTWACQAPSAAYDPRLGAARRRLVARATEARARGLALGYAFELGGDDGRRWLARHFYGAPWPVVELDSVTTTILATLADDVEQLGKIQAEGWPGVLRLTSAPQQPCASGPFLAAAGGAQPAPAVAARKASGKGD